MKWFTATAIMLFSLTAAMASDEAELPFKKVLVERDVKIGVEVFHQGFAVCLPYDGLKTVTINSLSGEYSFTCVKRNIKISFSRDN